MKEIYMPKNGMDMTEGTLIRWLKQEGDTVEFGEPIIEIETDKVTMEAESPASGVLLKKLYEDGAVIPVLTTIGYVGEAGEKLPNEEQQAPAVETPAAVVEPVSGDDYQVAVIGGGPAGYVAAIRAAQLGAKTVLFEKDTVGGTCLNRGCIPTKTYLKTAEYLHHIKNAGSRGIVVGEPKVDMPAVVANKNQVVKTLTSGVQGLLRSNGVEVVAGEAKLTAADTIVCNGKQYVAKKIILCGGSKAIRIPIPGVENENVLTSNEILDLQEVPEKLCIIGGGVIGCEMASAFSAFGSQVTIVEQMDRLVAVMDHEISAEVTKGLKEQGVAIFTSEKVVEIKAQGAKTVVVTGSGQIECDKVLLSIGRAADLDCLGDLADQIKVERGKVVVDDTMQTSIPNIYACGDINGRSMLAHSASQMAEVAAENCVKGEGLKCDLSYVPSVLYTMPEAASVGLTEEKAKQLHPEGVLVGKFPLYANSRAVAYGEKQGFVKVIADKTYGEILGAHIVGGMASEMIAEATALMVAEATIQDAAFHMIHGHPSYSEAFMEACKDALGVAIHIPAKKK